MLLFLLVMTLFFVLVLFITYFLLNRQHDFLPVLLIKYLLSEDYQLVVHVSGPSFFGVAFLDLFYFMVACIYGRFCFGFISRSVQLLQPFCFLLVNLFWFLCVQGRHGLVWSCNYL